MIERYLDSVFQRPVYWGMGLGAAFCAIYGPISVWGLPDMSAGTWAGVLSLLGIAVGTPMATLAKMKIDERNRRDIETIERWNQESEDQRVEREFRERVNAVEVFSMADIEPVPQPVAPITMRAFETNISPENESFWRDQMGSTEIRTLFGAAYDARAHESMYP